MRIKVIKIFWFKYKLKQKSNLLLKDVYSCFFISTILPLGLVKVILRSLVQVKLVNRRTRTKIFKFLKVLKTRFKSLIKNL